MENETRKWTAQIVIDPETGAYVGKETVQATHSEYDTLNSQTTAAVREAVEYLTLGLGTEALVILFKQLKSDKQPVRNRDFFVYRDARGQYRYQR